MAMTVDVAKEHIKDGSDCIAEAMRTIKRVKKNFPQSDEQLTKVEAHLKLAQNILNGEGVLAAGAASNPLR